MPEAARLRWSEGLLPATVITLAALLLWLWFGWQPGAPGHDLAHAPGASPTGGDFVLDSADGPVRLADYRGQWVLVYFGYTVCPDVCPTNLALLGRALRMLTPQERAQIQAIFVSVDPQRDTLAHLKQYAAYFHPEILGATANPAVLQEIAERYGVVFHRSEDSGSAMGYLIDHTAMTYLIDPQGRLRNLFDHATPAERMVAVIRPSLVNKSVRGIQ
jgi:protein SCO1/2